MFSMDISTSKEHPYFPPRIEIIEIELEEPLAQSQTDDMNPLPPHPRTGSKDVFRTHYPTIGQTSYLD